VADVHMDGSSHAAYMAWWTRVGGTVAQWLPPTQLGCDAQQRRESAAVECEWHTKCRMRMRTGSTGERKNAAQKNKTLKMQRQ